MKCTRVSPLPTEGEGSTQNESSKGVKIVHLEACVWMWNSNLDWLFTRHSGYFKRS